MFYRNSIRLPKVKVATGLYSNIDSIVRVGNDTAGWLRNSKSKKPRLETLKSMEEVVYLLKKSSIDGNSESFVSKGVYNNLVSLFPKRAIRTGGNGNNMGKALFEQGLMPLVSYPMRPERLMKASENFSVACGNKIKKPIDAIMKGDPDYEHIIFESDKYRSIFSWDMMTTRGIFDEDFLRLAFNPKAIDIVVIGYAHLILPKYKKRTDYLLDSIKDKRPKVHLEFGLGSEESMIYAMERFSEEEACDSWGMDEKECMIYFKAASENKEDLIEAALRAIKEYNLRRICVHSPKFVFSISKYDPAKESEALAAGCMAAGLKAIGRLPTNKIIPVKKRLDGYNFCLVPTFFSPHPNVLTGLGDVLASVQAVKSLC